MVSDPEDDLLSKMVSACDAAARFAAMTDRELVAQCAKTDAADYLVVLEMMRRLDPHWADEMRITEGGPF